MSDDAADAPFTVFVKTVMGKTITIEAKSSNTVAELKAIIAEKESFPVDIISGLSFAQKQIVDDRTLADYNMQKESTVMMFLKAPPKKEEDSAAAPASGGDGSYAKAEDEKPKKSCPCSIQ